MSCCGSARRQWAARHGSGRAAASPPEPPAPQNAVALRYGGGADMALRGPASGRIYRVGTDRRTLEADPRDAEALLATGLFVASSSRHP